MASKKPAKKRTARKLHDFSGVYVPPDDPGKKYHWQCLGEITQDRERANAPTGLGVGEPVLIPEIPRVLGGLEISVGHLESALKALRQKLQPIMVNQPADKPPYVSSASTEVGCKIESISVRVHDVADTIELLTNNCLGI